MATDPQARATVWRWPVRLFHWSVAALVAAQFVTADVLDGALEWHLYVGYTLLALVLFRIAWGFAGDRHALFADFVRGPSKTLGYARSALRGAPPASVGHNPLGGWSVVALLLVLLTQAISGLFMSDDIFTEGPLFAHVSDDLAIVMSVVHETASKLLLALIALHLAAIAWHRLRFGERLVSAMVTGMKHNLPQNYTPSRARSLLAVILLGVSGAAVTALVLVARATAPETGFY